MKKITIYTKENCPYCTKAKELLSSRQLSYQEIRIDLDEHQREEMIRLSNKRTVPQIFIDELPIGGFDDLAALAKSGKLDQILKA